MKCEHRSRPTALRRGSEMKHSLVRVSACATSILACLLFVASCAAQSTSALSPMVITGADRRPATSLDGDWASIVDPYFNGLFSFHHEVKANGWFLNRKAQPGDTFPT